MLRKLALAGVCLAALGGCVSSPHIVAASTSCTDLVPAAWKIATPGAPLPDGDTQADWVKFSDAQTAQLDKANGQKVDGFGIIERCQARDAAAIKTAGKRKFF